MAFVWFLVGFAFYVAFLVWCFLPIIRRQGPSWSRWLRAGLGTLLLAANAVPLLAWPILVPVSLVGGPPTSSYLLAVVLFPRTLPYYIENVLARQDGTARVVSVRYPIEIDGVRYAPVVHTVCTQRKVLSLDKGLVPQTFAKFPTAQGNGLFAEAGDSILTLDHGREICSDVMREEEPDFGDLQHLAFVVIRGESDTTQIYMLRDFAPHQLKIDGIIFHSPELVSIVEKPARQVVGLHSLWPMRRESEQGSRMRGIVRQYQKLPVLVRPCIEFISARIARNTLRPQIRRYRARRLPEEAKADLNAYCRRELRRLVPARQMNRLQPASQVK